MGFGHQQNKEDLTIIENGAVEVGVNGCGKFSGLYLETGGKA
jgi:hypothetical protein